MFPLLETIQLICSANQATAFNIRATFVVKHLSFSVNLKLNIPKKYFPKKTEVFILTNLRPMLIVLEFSSKSSQKVSFISPRIYE